MYLKLKKQIFVQETLLFSSSKHDRLQNMGMFLTKSFISHDKERIDLYCNDLSLTFSSGNPLVWKLIFKQYWSFLAETHLTGSNGTICYALQGGGDIGCAPVGYYKGGNHYNVGYEFKLSLREQKIVCRQVFLLQQKLQPEKGFVNLSKDFCTFSLRKESHLKKIF